MKQYPSIFNDVIGPVMIGQSSSHTAAAVRIGLMIRQLSGGLPKEISFSFDTRSSLATTYKSQGSEAGLLAGLLGFGTSDARIADAGKYAAQAGLNAIFEVKDIGAGHPNAYYCNLTAPDGRVISLTAISTGGGMIEITEFMGFPISVDGGFHEVLILCDGLVNRKYEREPDTVPDGAFCLSPILPVKSQLKPRVPFCTAEGILNYPGDLRLSELALIYESERSGLPQETILANMKDIIRKLRDSITAEPTEGTDKSRILPNQAGLMADSTNVLGGSFNRNIIKYVTRLMDIKASGGVFVAAPTAGSCGALCGTVFALADELGLDDAAMARGLLSAGLVGVLIAHGSTFAAELCGCQAECGAGSGMAAAACAEIAGGSAGQCLDAAAAALQNVFGMVCDPVGNKVEVPCLGKNVMAAQNAVACANMALAGYSEPVGLDDTIAAFDAVGRALPRELRCTGLGGLSLTRFSRELSVLY